jgi:glycosyltransferase involved in cell wall biosynthesis
MKLNISIAMATYNGAKHLKAQLDSISNQSFLPYEVVIADDCSTDDTIKIVEDWRSTVKFQVKIHRNSTNLGFANNFMQAAELCTGNWIAFCDQDDVWYPEKLAKIIATIDATRTKDLVLVCHMADVVDENLVKTGQRLPEIARAKVMPRGAHYGFWVVGGCVMVFDASLIREVDSARRPPDDWLPIQPGFKGYPWLPHDKWVCMLANALGSTAYIPEALGAYRRHGTTVTGDHAKLAVAERIRKAALTGGAYYRFLSATASQTAAALRVVASELSGENRRRMLRESAASFDTLAHIQNSRAALYEATSYTGQFKLLIDMINKKFYFGKKFYSLGWVSLAKDIAMVIKSWLTRR